MAKCQQGWQAGDDVHVWHTYHHDHLPSCGCEKTHEKNYYIYL